MKRLGLYLFIGVILVGAFGGFVSPEKIYAQQSVSVESALVVGGKIFETSKLNLDRELVSINQKYPDKNSQGFKDEKATNDVERTSLLKSKNTFEEIMTTKTEKTTPQLYEDALSGAINSLTSDKNSIPALTTDKFIQTFIAELDAEKTNKERLSSIGSGKVISTEAQNASKSTAQSANPTGAKRLDTSACNMFGTGNLLTCLDQLVAEFIKVTLLEIAGFLLWFSSNIFNLAIQIGVLHFDKWAPEELYKVFVVVRQIVSLVILFTGLYLVGLYIIGREQKITHFLPWLALFALFVNFSYPMTRALVDISNVVTLNIYSSVVGPQSIEGKGDATAGGIIINRLGLGKLAAGAAGVRKVEAASFVGSIESTPGALMAVAYVLYAAYILFMSAAIFIFRTAALVFLTIISPLLFVDSVVPLLGDHAVKLRKIFVEQLLVAPLFMVMLALTLKFLDVFQTGTGPLAKLGTSSLSSGNTGSLSLFFNILMMLIMLHIMYKVTKSVSGTVGEAATNMMGKVGGFGMGLASGGTGILARASLGRVAAAARDSNWITDNKNGFLGKTAFRMTNSLAQGNYDVRNVGAVAGGMKKAGMGMGTGTTKNYEQAKEEKDKQKVEDYAAVGTYRSNVYNADGTLLHRKGEMDTSRRGAREKFMKDAGSVFTVKTEAQQKMQDSDKAYTSKAKSEYSSLKGDEKKAYYSKQDAATQGVLKAQADKDNTRLVNEYETLSPEKQKTFLARQDEDNQAAMQEIMRTPKEQRGQPSTGAETASESTGGEVDYDIPSYRRGVNQSLREKLGEKEVAQSLKEEPSKKEAADEDVERKAIDEARESIKKSEDVMKEAAEKQRIYDTAKAEINREKKIDKERGSIKKDDAYDMAVAEDDLRQYTTPTDRPKSGAGLDHKLRTILQKRKTADEAVKKINPTAEPTIASTPIRASDRWEARKAARAADELETV